VVVAEIEVIHVRRRIDAAQRAIEGERLRVERARGALRDLHLHDVAGQDVLLAAPHRVEKSALGECAIEPRRLGRFILEEAFVRQRPGQPRAQVLEPRLGIAFRAGLSRVGVHHEVELAEHVVEHRELVRDQKQHVRSTERVGLFFLQRILLDVTHALVAEIARQPAAEAQRRRNRRDAVRGEPCARILERIGIDALKADIGAARIA
jgi:hypothetical protein